MVASHLAGGVGIGDPTRARGRWGAVPREAFVPAKRSRDFAYEDSALAIEAGQTISQPYIVARMIELLVLEPHRQGCSRGRRRLGPMRQPCSAALRGKVFAIERHEVLANQSAQGGLARLGLRQCRDYLRRRHLRNCLTRPAVRRHPCLCRRPRKWPESLKLQLTLGGSAWLMPVGPCCPAQNPFSSSVRLGGITSSRKRTTAAVTFVPLIGAQGLARAGRG